MRIDFASQTRLFLGLYELELVRFLGPMLTAGATTFDVGAQHGYDSLLAANQTHARVAAFECDTQCIGMMRSNFALNSGLEGLIEIVQGTVGDGNDDVGLDAWAYGAKGFVPDVIKLDIDGGEMHALQSARRILRERKPSCVIETHSLELERACGRLLVECGYEPRVVNQRTFSPDWRPTTHNRWLVALGDA